MDTDFTDVLSRHSVRRHRLTADEYHRLGEAGVLGEADRVELLEGQLMDVSPIGPRHALAADALTELLVMAVAGRAGVRVQNPIELDDRTEVHPDIALVRRPWAKLELYARAGIREFWIVDLSTGGVLVYRNPSGGRYGSMSRVERSGVLEVEALPGVAIPAASLFA